MIASVESHHVIGHPAGDLLDGIYAQRKRLAIVFAFSSSMNIPASSRLSCGKPADAMDVKARSEVKCRNKDEECETIWSPR